MKTHYDSEADALYVRFTDTRVEESEEVRPGIVFDFDAEGRLVAVEIPGEPNTLPATATRDAAQAAGLAADIAPSVQAALDAIAAVAPSARVLICGSLYLAGQILRENG